MMPAIPNSISKRLSIKFLILSPKAYIKTPRAKNLIDLPSKHPRAKGHRGKAIEPALKVKALKGKGLKAPKNTNKNVLS